MGLDIEDGGVIDIAPISEYYWLTSDPNISVSTVDVLDSFVLREPCSPSAPDNGQIGPAHAILEAVDAENDISDGLCGEIA